MATNQDVVLKIRVLDAQKAFLGGSVDITFEHTQLAERRELRAVDASREITVKGLRRAPEGSYKVFVTRAEPWMQKTQFVTIPASGVATLDIVFEQVTENASFVVRGVISLEDGTPTPNLIVVAIDRDFRAEQALGEARTDRGGNYRITYTAAAFTKAEKGAADLGVKILSADRKTLLYAPKSRDLLMNAPADAVIDVKVALPLGGVASEFEKIGEELRPLLRGVPASDVAREAGTDEGEFLARETGFDVSRIAHFVVAHRVGELAEIRPDYFYALLREDGLFGITPGRPRSVLTPVFFNTDTKAVLFEAVLLDPALAKAAIHRAVRKRIVPPSVEQEAPALQDALALRREAALAYVNQEVPRIILTMLEDLIEDGKAEDILALLGPVDIADLGKIFARLDRRGVFADPDREKAESRLKLGDLLGFNLGLVEEVTASLGATTPEAARALARLERKDWTELITKGTQRITLGGRQIDPALARRQASIIVRRFEKTFPTVAFTAQLARHKPSAIPEHGQLVEFLDAHPDFELGQHRLGPFLKTAGIESTNVAPELLAGIEKLQRVFQLAGDYRKTVGLLEAGYTASADIVATGQTRFLADAKSFAGMGKAEANRVFRQAQDTHLGAVLVATNLRTLTWPKALEGATAKMYAKHIKKIVAEQPDLASLFGSTDVCECRHCRSIYGPAAYFADVMRFLRHRSVIDTTLPSRPSTKTAKQVLFARRPDLGEIDLNCDNAEVPVPHIDIVCELLEETVAPDPGFIFRGRVAAGQASAALLAAVRLRGYDISSTAVVYGPHARGRFILRDKNFTILIVSRGSSWRLRRLRQTHGTPEERAAAPEYVNAGAYTTLAAGRAAFGLPFDLFHAETRAFLAAAGIDRAALMEVLGVEGAASASNPALAREDVIAGEILGLSAGERRLISLSSVADQPAIWAVPRPAARTMKKLDVFMQRTGLEYRGVENLLAGRWVRHSRNLFIRHLDNTCNLALKEIVNLDDGVLDRIHRVLRLARRTGLAARDIDRLAAGPKLGGGDLGSSALHSLADLVHVSADLHVEMGRLMTWLDVIPTDGDRSEHALLFQNPTATGPLAAALAPAAIRQNEEAVATVPPGPVRLADVQADLTLAFGVRLADLQLLLDHLEGESLLRSNPPLTFRALAELHGRIGLARALGLKMADLLALERLSGFDPLANAALLRRFVEAARAVEKVKIGMAELEYRLARRATDPTACELNDAAIGPMLETIRAGLVTAAATHRTPYDENLKPLEQVGAFEAQLERQAGLAPAEVTVLADLIRLDAPGAAARDAALAVVAGPLAGLVDRVEVVAAIYAVIAAASGGAEAERQRLLNLVMNGLSASALRAAAFEVANTRLASLLRLSTELAAVILSGAHLAEAARRTPLADLLTTGQMTDKLIEISPRTTPDLYRAVRLAHAVAEFMRPFDPSPERVAFLFENATALGWLRPDGLPFEAELPVVPLEEWLELADFFALLEEFPAVSLPGRPGETVSVPSVFQLALHTVPPEELLPDKRLLDALAILTGWPRARVEEADMHLGFQLADYRKPATWRTLGRAVDFLHRLGVPLAEAADYTAPVLRNEDRANARRLLRARYSDTDWLGALKAIMDPIREQKRDALVAQLLASNPRLTSKADLYDYFLTDTEWSAKMPSSRLVHAHGTVQLFIQRCIARLEPKATADLDGDPDWRIWDWMKNYRVWEVNRKVFIEAHYYLRPEWRDDKTEPFADFEGAILQNEINEENVNAAFEGYLDHLDQIAFLDVLATCYDFDHEEMHVFAATKGGEPRGYFHRVLQQERVWTPWKKIDLDIAGEHLVAFFRNKRLFLAWATFLEKAEELQRVKFPEPKRGIDGNPERDSSGNLVEQDLPPARRRTEIRLAVSEYTGKKWLPRRVSEGALLTDLTFWSLNLRRIFLTVTPDPELFAINVFIEGDYANTLENTDLPSSEAEVGHWSRLGYFSLTGCKGYPEAMPTPKVFYDFSPNFKEAPRRGQRIIEQASAYRSGDDLAIASIVNGVAYQTLFGLTPGTFRVTYPPQASELDRLLVALDFFENHSPLSFGAFMPFFFEDNHRGYVLVPGFYGGFDEKTSSWRVKKTFSKLRQLCLDLRTLSIDFLIRLVAAKTPAEREVVLDRLAADPEHARILDEIKSYYSTTFGYVVRNFYHPLSCFLRQHFFEGGVPALLARKTQREIGSFRFEDPASGHAPSSIILQPYPKEELEFGRESAYAAYNWELTFHIPHLIASKLMEAERFDEAERWLRYIFDPLGSSNEPAPKRYWNTKPFYERDPAEYGEQLVTAIFERLAREPNRETELTDAIAEWRRNPFKPYLVARSRTVAFQQAIVDLTIRLFIGRGDQAFRRDQLEDLVMASLDYSRAERLLGPRPKLVPPAIEVPPETYDQLESKLDAFCNALRRIENLLPDLSVLPHGGAELPPPPIGLESLYFCIPPSEKLYELWDLLEERQFNLRNSRTIDGVERTLSLFAPPLSVEALIKAAAAGLSVSEILSSLSAPRPPHRFRVMLRHALECAETANGLSRALEQALGSRDGEGLARLKAEQEIRFLQEQKVMLLEEIRAAGLSIESAKIAKLMHQETQSFYANRPYMNALESAAAISYGISFGLQTVMAIGYAAAGGLALVPSFMVGAAGFGGSPTANVKTGGEDFSASARDLMVGTVGALGAAFDKAGSMLEHQGNFQTRKEDWDNSSRMAQREVERTDLEIRMAAIRETIANEQLRLNEVRRQQAAAEETYLRTKFTNRELLDWLAQELRSLSKQMFNLAFEAARAAERCYNFELGTTDSFVRAGQWNDTRRGLLASENLITDLRRMENKYLQRNVRELELTKHLSLARLDPIALIALRTTGECRIQIPEAVFDLEHPGHYFRRIKALSVSVPCVSGPYTSVPLKLTQTSNRVRVETGRKDGATTDADAYAEVPGNDPRFRYNVGSIQSIATSRGTEDGGLFEVNLGDDRYLPFEGSGVCGSFELELPKELWPFDYGTISDVVFHLRYTARDGGGGFKTMVANGLQERLNLMVLKTGRTGLFQAFDLRRDRPNVWHRLITTGTTTLTLTTDDFPYFTSSPGLSIASTQVLARIAGNPENQVIIDRITVVWGEPNAETELAGPLSSSVAGVALGAPVTIVTALPNKIEEMILVVNYTMTA